MFGVGSYFLSGWDGSGSRGLVSRAIEALNDRRYDDLEQLLTPDATYLDAMSNAIEGAPAIIRAFRGLRTLAPDLMIELASLDESGDSVLVRGRMTSANPEFCSLSLWRVCVEGGKLREIQAFRDHNAISLPALTQQIIVPATV